MPRRRAVSVVRSDIIGKHSITRPVPLYPEARRPSRGIRGKGPSVDTMPYQSDAAFAGLCGAGINRILLASLGRPR
jgi:hypothetical protein